MSKKKSKAASGNNFNSLMAMFRRMKNQVAKVHMPFFIALYNYKVSSTNWVQAKYKLHQEGGPDWPMIKFECASRVGAGTLPPQIWGLVTWSKLAKMPYSVAVDITNNKLYDVRCDPNTQRTVKIAYKDMNDRQRNWLIGTNGAILPPHLQQCPAIPKVRQHDAEDVRLEPNGDFVALYHNQRGRCKEVIVPPVMWQKFFTKKKGK